MAGNAIESDFRSSKMAAGSHFVNKIKKLARNAIEIHFRSFKMGGGGGGHHNGQSVNHSGIYTVFALGQMHQFQLMFVIT